MIGLKRDGLTDDLLFGADTADGATAGGARALGYGLSVFSGALYGVLHGFLLTTLHAIRFDAHERNLLSNQDRDHMGKSMAHIGKEAFLL